MASCSHILAGFSLGFFHRHELKRLLVKTPGGMSVLDLDPEALRSSKVEAMAIDFDGVLANHAAPTPLHEAVEWLKRCQTVFGGDRIFILSNKPTNERRLWFTANFPAIRFISDVRKKPFADGLIKTGELAGVPVPSIIMIDDRLLTGCLAALLAGARPCYIRRPYVSFCHRPLSEIFFFTLRALERFFVRIP